MSNITVVEGDFLSAQGKYALLVSRWNSFVVEHLKEGALDTLKRHGINDEDITIYYAPGAFEMPVLAQRVDKFVICAKSQMIVNCCGLEIFF